MTDLPDDILKALRDGRNAVLPGGTFTVRQTIELPHASGQSVTGAGRMIDVRLGASGPGTTLLWLGAPGQPMFTADGATYLSMTGVSLTGRLALGKWMRGGPLVWCRSTPERGAAGWVFDRVDFRDAGVGVQFGKEAGEGCASDSTFRNCCFEACDAGVRTLNDQSVNHEFMACGFLSCGVALDVQRGGNVHVRGGALQNCGWLLKSGPGGGNVRVMTVHGLRVENDLRVQVAAGRDLLLEDVQMSGPPGVYEATVANDASVTRVRGFPVEWVSAK
jgi:hypothetical protein